MTTRLWITALICAALVVGAVGAAQALPANDPGPRRVATQVLGRAAVRPDSTTSTGAAPSSTSSTTASSSSTAPPRTAGTTAATTARIALPTTPRPGRMAAPSPATPVRLTGSTPVIDRVPTTEKVIFLGVDDGLVRDPALIELLREERIPLTLFLVSQPAKDGRDFFRAMVELGSTVQDHTITHPRMPTLGATDQRKQVCNEIPTLTTNFGVRPTLFRPPYGEWNATTRSAVANCGLKAIILWRGATNDGRLDIVGGRFHPGDILLMHFRKDLVQNLHVVLARAQAEGYKIGRLEDWIGSGPPHPMFPRGG